jgi:hypothetical protein
LRSAARGLIVCAALTLAWGGAARAQEAVPPPSRQEVQAAAARVAQDPNLGSKVKEKTLRFKSNDKKPEKPEASPSLKWLMDLLQWLSETARLLVWAGGALAVALLLVGLRRWILARAEARTPALGALPSHVQSLDIRPESLPDDVGGAAAALWQRGEHRAALSLLYRGALSRLVHDHAVPIRAATTEGECLALARRALDAGRGEFFARLVRAWQLAVYGARLPPEADALALCRDFELHLRAAPRIGAAR